MTGAAKTLCAAVLAGCAVLPAAAEKVRVAYCVSAGFCEERAGGRVDGFNPEWIGRIADATGWEIERVDLDFPEAYEMLKAGKVDILPSVPYTEASEKEVLFSHIHSGILRNYLFAPKGRGFDPAASGGWSGISVGIVKGSNLAEVIPLTPRLRGFNPVFRVYQSQAEAVEAMMSGRCRAIACAPSRDILEKCVSLLELPGTPLYFCVAPSRPDLRDELDRAVTAVYGEYPMLDHQLMTRHFPPVGGNMVPLTAEETEWVKRRNAAGRTVAVDISPERAPLKHIGDDGEISGFLGRLLREVSRSTGLKFSCLAPAGPAEARKRFASGDAELWANFDADLVGLKSQGTVIPTTEIPQVAVSRSGHPLKPLNEAVVAADRGNTDRIEAYGRLGMMDRVVLCDDDDACVKAVMKGDADVFVCSFSTAAECVRRLKCEGMVTIRPDDASFYIPTFNVAISPAADPMLAQIVGKALRSFSRDELTSMLYTSGAEASEPAITVRQVWTIVSVSAILVLGFMTFWSRRASGKVRRALADTAAALDAAAKANGELRVLNEHGGQIRGVLKMLAEDYDNKSKILQAVRAASELLGAEHATVVRRRSDGSFERMLCWQRDESAAVPAVRPDVPGTIADMLEGTQRFVWPVAGSPENPHLRRLLDDFGCKAIFVTRLQVKGQNWGFASFMGAEMRMDDTGLLDEIGRILEIAARRQLLDAEVDDRRHELETALSSAECAARAKTVFLSAMSHDIRTPLNAITGFADLIGRPGISQDELKEYSEGISRSSNELLALLTDVLDLARLDTTDENQREGVCDFRKLFGEMTAVFRVAAGAKKLSLSSTIADGFPLLRLSEQRMRQILRTLIGNAVRHTGSGKVSFSATAVGDSVGTVTLTVTVSDTGSGMPADALKRIFDPFAGRDPVSGRRTYADSGLGLPIVKRIVESAGGEISVDSREGVGTVFMAEFPKVEVVNAKGGEPAHDASASATRPESGSQPSSEEEGDLELPSDLRVLVVDDVPLNLRILSLYIHKLGVFFIQSASSGAKALEAMRRERPDIVFTDLWMPGMSGAELAAEIRGDPELSEIPIVAVTADSDSQKTFDTAVFNRVITKPVTSAKVREIFASLYPPGGGGED